MREWFYWNVKRRLQLFPFWFARRLPRWVVYYATLRLVSYATCGKYGNTIVPELTAVDALKRWEDQNGKA